MLNYTIPWRGKWPLPIREIWFAREGESVCLPWPILPQPVRVFYAACRSPRASGLVGRWEEWQTLMTSLASLTSLESKLKSNTRYDIRRAFERDGFAADPDWTASQLVQFANEHDPVNPNRPDRFKIDLLVRAGRMRIVAGSSEGMTLCVHAYVHDGRHIRLLHSYSRRPRPGPPNESEAVGTKEFAAKVGRANKALHWHDLILFRDEGFEVYDWGGYSGKGSNGIDRFKMLFLGELHTDWQFVGMALPRTRALRF